MGKGFLWLIFILILVFLILNFGRSSAAILKAGGEQSVGLIQTLQGGGRNAPIYRGV